MGVTQQDLLESDPAKARTIPSLDGIRAVAVLCVIWGHGAATLEQTGLVTQLRSMLPGGSFGVQMFFVLSGFLITTLLVREQARTGRISLLSFYRRRAYRILPALFAFLTVVLILALTGTIDGIGLRDFLASAFFLRDYYPLDGSWWLGHTWSLSVEEQFYILWPLLVIVLPRRIAVRVLLAGILVSPVVRLATFALPFVPEGGVTYMFHTRADGLMVGCLLAFLVGAPRFEAILARLFALRLQWAIVVWLPVSWIMTMKLQGIWMYTVGYTGDALAIALLMLWMIRRPDSAFGKVLNWRPVVHLGLISYSLYLYQQLFLTKHNETWFSGLTIGGIAALLVVAELSYWGVERPFLRLRVRRDRRAAETARLSANDSTRTL